MALDPSALEAGPDASPPTADPIAPAVAPVAPGTEPSAATQEPPKPTTYTAEEWFSSPEYQSRKDKEIAAERTRWQRQESDRITAQAAAAERDRAVRERAQLVQQARAGDLDAQAKLAEDEYVKLVAANSADGFRTQWVGEADAAVKALADGDAELEAKLSWRNFNSVQDWSLAMADARADKRVQAEAEALAEAKFASGRAVERNGKPNPDTAEMVGGHGGPVASLSIEELNARYAKAKDDGNSEEVARLKSVLHRRAPVMAGRR